MSSVIYIDNDGNLKGLADDVLDKLDSLGRKMVERVSNIEFDHEHQCWIATDLEGRVIAADVVRSAVIEEEREYFNTLIEQTFASAVEA